MLFNIILYLCDPHYTLLYYQLYRYLVSLYQIIWTFIDPENGDFWKTYLDKEKMLVTSSFSCYYNVFYSTLTKFNFHYLQMLSIWTYQNFCHLVWRYSLVTSTASSPVADPFYKTSTLFVLPFKLKIIKLNFHYLTSFAPSNIFYLGFIVDLVIFLLCIKSIHVHALFTNRASFWINESGRSVYCELLQNFFPKKILSVERYVIADYFDIKQMNVT